MTDFNPTNHMRDRCNEMCNSLWKHMDKLDEYIEKIPDGQSKDYLRQYRQTLGFIAELYFFNAVTLGSVNAHEEWLKSIHVKVFGNKEMPFPPKSIEKEGLDDIVKRYKEKEPTLDWLDKDLKDKAKDVEKNE